MSQTKDEHAMRIEEAIARIEAERPYEDVDCASLQVELESLQADLTASPAPPTGEKARLNAAIKEVRKEQTRKGC